METELTYIEKELNRILFSIEQHLEKNEYDLPIYKIFEEKKQLTKLIDYCVTTADQQADARGYERGYREALEKARQVVLVATCDECEGCFKPFCGGCGGTCRPANSKCAKLIEHLITPPESSPGDVE